MTNFRDYFEGKKRCFPGLPSARSTCWSVALSSNSESVLTEAGVTDRLSTEQIVVDQGDVDDDDVGGP